MTNTRHFPIPPDESRITTNIVMISEAVFTLLIADGTRTLSDGLKDYCDDLITVAGLSSAERHTLTYGEQLKAAREWLRAGVRSTEVTPPKDPTLYTPRPLTYTDDMAKALMRYGARSMRDAVTSLFADMAATAPLQSWARQYLYVTQLKIALGWFAESAGRQE